MEQGHETRWAARPVLARFVKLAVFLVPVSTALAASWVISRLLPPPDGFGDRAVNLAVLVAVSTLVLVGLDRFARRLLPLAALLELTMLFPDRAPSRVALAHDAMRQRPVTEQLAMVKEAGADPAVAAREILRLVAALRMHDRPTRGHAERVRLLTDLLATEMGVSTRDRDLLRWAALLHDIGKLRVPAAILNKAGKPTETEWVALRGHPQHGADIAASLLPWLGSWGDVILQHHERYDGTGYPQGLAGRQISFGARIVSVADAFDVMTAARSYKRPVSRAAAHRELVRWSGTQFDPAVVRTMLALSAPRLSKAQGALAWLGNVPFVASGSVPAATVAKVVGAGALASGAATGLVVTSSVPPAHETASLARVVSSSAATRDARAAADSAAALDRVLAGRGARTHRAEQDSAELRAGATVTELRSATSASGADAAARAADPAAADPASAGSTADHGQTAKGDSPAPAKEKRSAKSAAKRANPTGRVTGKPSTRPAPPSATPSTRATPATPPTRATPGTPSTRATPATPATPTVPTPRGGVTGPASPQPAAPPATPANPGNDAAAGRTDGAVAQGPGSGNGPQTAERSNGQQPLRPGSAAPGTS